MGGSSDHTEPAEALLDQYRHTLCLRFALQAQIEDKSYRRAAADIGHGVNTFKKHMKRSAFTELSLYRMNIVIYFIYNKNVLPYYKQFVK